MTLCKDCDPATGLVKPCPECQKVGLTQPIISAADHERALAVIEERTDLSEEQRTQMRQYVEAHYLRATKNG